MIELSVGLACVALGVLVAKKYDLEIWAYSASLLALALVYMLFGLFSTGQHVILKELLYGVPFILIGLVVLYFDFRLSAYLVAFTWLIYADYDLGHDSLFLNDGVPSWYPLLCAVFDFGLGGYLVYLAGKIPETNVKVSAEAH